MTPMPTRLLPLDLAPPRTTAEWLEEPKILFAGERRHIDPKTGVTLYGPRSLGTSRHKREVHVGFIGTGESADAARKFYRQVCSGVPGDLDHEPFPGCNPDQGYHCEIHTDLVEPIKRNEHTEIVEIRKRRQRFEAFLALLQQKMDLITNRDHPLDYIVLALPQELYRECRSVEYVEKGLGLVYRNLRRAFKAMAMQFSKPTQILLATTTGLTTSTRKLDHPSKIAWNLFTGLYFKVEGLPWGPTELTPGSCHVGISFYRPLGETSTLRTSVVQAFDSNGEGLVLRGHKFHWDEEKEGRSPHLPAEQAQQLVDLVLCRYRRENEDRPPLRVVIHKTSRFEPEERAGFEQALRGVSRYDLVSLSPTSEVRLLRSGQYPPLRGTVFTIGDVSYCYTSGYLRSLDRYPHGHVPSPLQVADHVGDTPMPSLLREIMVLTKMNWNSANMAGLMPITLRFSRLVGDVLREVPENREPQAKSWYYM
jgi:hypothetical protein